MSYTTDDITYLGSDTHDLARTIRAWTGHCDKVIQLYLDGRLVGSQRPADGSVTFVVPDVNPSELAMLLAVDEADALVDYWPEAFGASTEHGNKLRLRLPRWVSYGQSDTVLVYLGDPGSAEADRLICREAMFPGGRRGGGRGMDARGYGGRGWYLSDAAGRGRGARGYGERGFYAKVFEITSDVLTPGTYPVKVVIEDEAGNTSPAFETTVAVETYARPASALVVVSHDAAAGTLTLTWTESPDI